MSIYRLIILVIAAMTMALTSGRSEDVPVIPDGVYRDAGGVAVLTIQGKKAVLETSLLGGKHFKVAGEHSVHPNGDFYLRGVAMASNQYDALFGRREWTWKEGHFVVKETVPPSRTLQLKRQ